jgi:hypothetical protein
VKALQQLLERNPLPPAGLQAREPDLFDVLDKVAAELKADGVRLSYEGFRRNLAAFEGDS